MIINSEPISHIYNNCPSLTQNHSCYINLLVSLSTPSIYYICSSYPWQIRNCNCYKVGLVSLSTPSIYHTYNSYPWQIRSHSYCKGLLDLAYNYLLKIKEYKIWIMLYVSKFDDVLIILNHRRYNFTNFLAFYLYLFFVLLSQMFFKIFLLIWAFVCELFDKLF